MEATWKPYGSHVEAACKPPICQTHPKRMGPELDRSARRPDGFPIGSEQKAFNASRPSSLYTAHRQPCESHVNELRVSCLAAMCFTLKLCFCAELSVEMALPLSPNRAKNPPWPHFFICLCHVAPASSASWPSLTRGSTTGVQHALASGQSRAKWPGPPPCRELKNDGLGRRRPSAHSCRCHENTAAEMQL